LDDLYINDEGALNVAYEEGKAVARAQYSVAMDKEDGPAIDTICDKAANLPVKKRWLSDAGFTGFSLVCAQSTGCNTTCASTVRSL
jgi:hypothetical protein